jgi:hypothetical protein
VQPSKSHQRPIILLTTVCRPFGNDGDGDSVGAELFHSQVTRNQGIFSYRQVIRCWGLDYIAENLETPTVILHYPSEQEFLREIRARYYDYIGINFVVATFHKAKRLAQMIRKHSPGSKIVLGGYGTVLPQYLLDPVSDCVCREEGIRFMRRLLKEDSDRPIRHPYAPIESPRIYSYPLKTKVAHVTGGLGCPNGCDFCCTSHFFKRKYVPFAKTGQDLYDALQKMERRSITTGDILSGFILIDEDFFIHTKRAREFLHCVRKGGRPLSIMGFGSIKGLSQFTADEIAEMGFDIVWTAFEGVSSGYDKLEGKNIGQLYEDLKSKGVAILSSMIIGFPYQDSVRVREEVRRFQALGPALWQILIYFAFPGTPLHKKAVAQKRFLPAYEENPDYRTFDGFTMHFTHPHFTAEEIEALQKKIYRDNFQRLGPSLVRVVKAWFDGYRNLRDSDNPLLQGRAERMREYVRSAIPGIWPAMVFGPNPRIRAEARAFLKDIEFEMGPMSIAERISSWLTLPFCLWTWLSTCLSIGQQPKLIRIEHRL